MRFRRATADDTPALVRLFTRVLGWREDRRHEAHLAWKHERNPFGRSLLLVATEAGEVVGARGFLRWEFRLGDRSVSAARGVDTATHPDHRRRGIFSELTRRGIEILGEEGVAFIFETPSEQSRPGLERMGWQVLGRLPARVRPVGVGGLLRMTTARGPAGLWGLPVDAARPAGDVLPASLPGPDQVAVRPAIETNRTDAYLAWRYGFEDHHYRVLAVDEGLTIFRVRRRGGAREVTVCDVLGRPGSHRALRSVARRSSGDYLLALAGSPVRDTLGWAVPAPGPLLTWRPLAEDLDGEVEAWSPTLGDIEML